MRNRHLFHLPFFLAAVIVGAYAYDVKDKQALIVCLGLLVIALFIFIIVNEKNRREELEDAKFLGDPLPLYKILKKARDLQEGTTVQVYTKPHYVSQKELAFQVAHYNCTVELVQDVQDEARTGKLYCLYKYTHREQQQNAQIIRRDYP